eukprot:6183464-Pleurochrysis_carterae.AAC.2
MSDTRVALAPLRMRVRCLPIQRLGALHVRGRNWTSRNDRVVDVQLSSGNQLVPRGQHKREVLAQREPLV